MDEMGILSINDMLFLPLFLRSQVTIGMLSKKKGEYEIS